LAGTETEGELFEVQEDSRRKPFVSTKRTKILREGTKSADRRMPFRIAAGSEPAQGDSPRFGN
jgi:hypothetical protein